MKAGNEKSGVYDFTFGSLRGGIINDGLDVKSVRWGRHSDFERLVFDIYKWGGPTRPEGILPNDYPGSYIIKFESEDTLSVEFNGYRAFTAGPPDLFSSILLEEAKLQLNDGSVDESVYHYTIKLKKPVKLEVFELNSPARIVVDFKPTTQ